MVNSLCIAFAFFVGLVILVIIQLHIQHVEYRQRVKDCSSSAGVITGKEFESGSRRDYYYVYYKLEHGIKCNAIVAPAKYEQLKIGQRFFCNSEFCEAN